MTTIFSMLVIIIALGMLVAYNVGYTAGRREGFAAGVEEGKRKASIRAYAVGFDRGRRKSQESTESKPDDEPAVAPQRRRILLAGLSLIAVVMAAAALSKEFGTDRP